VSCCEVSSPNGNQFRASWSLEERAFVVVVFPLGGPGPFPAVLDLWGGGGGLVEYRAALVASHGFVSLALDYLTPKRSTAGVVSHVGNDYFQVTPPHTHSKNVLMNT